MNVINRMRGLALALAATGLAVSVSAPGHADAPIFATATLRADQPGPVINRDIYGQFVEDLGRSVYGGIYVGEASPIPNTQGFRNDVIAALREIRTPVIRWPGGCFADRYDWRDGIGPKASRPVRINNWGGVEDSNAVGTHEYMAFAELVGAQTYVGGNVGTGSPREMAQWVEYMTSPSHSALAEERRRNGRDKPFKLDFIGVGNEAWGCGGHMRPEHYVDLFRTFAPYLGVDGQALTKVAAGASGDNYAWTEAVMAGTTKLNMPNGGPPALGALSLHYYTFAGDGPHHTGPATGFDEDHWIGAFGNTLKMDELIAKHSAIMDKYDPAKHTALFIDEWGAWYDTEKGTDPLLGYQQNTLRDALIAAVNFDIFHAHADRVRMANISQLANVLQALVLTDHEKMLLTPTYYVFDMYKVFQDATALPLDIQTPLYAYGGKSVPAVHGTAARGTDGAVHIGLVNLDPHRPATVGVSLTGLNARAVTGEIMTAEAMDAHNTYEAPTTLTPQPFRDARLGGQTLTVNLPAKSVVVLDLR